MSIKDCAIASLLYKYIQFKPEFLTDAGIRNIERHGSPSSPIVIHLANGKFTIYVRTDTKELVEVTSDTLDNGAEITYGLDNAELYLDKLEIAACMQYAKMALGYYIYFNTQQIKLIRENIAYHNRCIDECNQSLHVNVKAIEYHSQKINKYMAGIKYLEAEIDKTWDKFEYL